MREIIALALLCLVLALVSLVVLVWAAFSGALFTLDGLLLAAICLTLAAMFGSCFLWLAYDAGWWRLLKSRWQTASNPKQNDTNR